jgi:hypothetical protein
VAIARCCPKQASEGAALDLNLHHLLLADHGVSRRAPPAPSCGYGEIGRGRFRPVRTVPRRSRPAGAQAAVRGWSCAGSMAGREGLLHPARIRASSSRNISICCSAALRGAQAAQARPIASRNRRGDQPGLADGRHHRGPGRRSRPHQHQASLAHRSGAPARSIMARSYIRTASRLAKGTDGLI